MNKEIEKLLSIISEGQNSIQLQEVKKYITNLQEENQKLKSNQVKTFNKIKDHINGCNCEISEGHYSNDDHSNYWKTFKEILEDIKNNLKKYDNNDYVYIPAWREKELLKIEEENEKLNKIIDELKKYIIKNPIYYNTSDGSQWVDQFKLLDKLYELKNEVE